MIEIHTLSDPEILAAVEPIMDKLMHGSTEIDHARLTRDCTDRMKGIVTSEWLAATCPDHQSRIGWFGPREFVGLLRRKASVAVVWKQRCSRSADELVAKAVCVPRGNGWRVDHAMVF